MQNQIRKQGSIAFCDERGAAEPKASMRGTTCGTPPETGNLKQRSQSFIRDSSRFTFSFLKTGMDCQMQGRDAAPRK